VLQAVLTQQVSRLDAQVTPRTSLIQLQHLGNLQGWHRKEMVTRVDLLL
jgi:hypothetical protein